MSTQVAVDLRAAADVLERDGWGRDFFHLANGCHCAEGAIAVATGYHFGIIPPASDDDSGTAYYNVHPSARHRYVDARNTLASYLRLYAGPVGVPEWNDEEAMNAAEVIAALRAAAVAAEAQS